MKTNAITHRSALRHLAESECQRRRAFALRAAAAAAVLGLSTGPAAALTVSTTVGPQTLAIGESLLVTSTGAINGGTSDAVDASGTGTFGTIVNQGSITTGANSSREGIVLENRSGGDITNSGSIITSGEAIYLSYSTAGAITNTGTIQSVNSMAIWIYEGSVGSLTNTATGTITSSSGVGIYLNSYSTANELINQGIINAKSSGISTGYTTSFNLISNSGTITTAGAGSDSHGIWLSSYSKAAAISNSGTIDTTASAGDGIQVYYSSLVGSVSNSGTINASQHGIFLTSDSTAGSVTNSGTINAAYAGIAVEDSDLVTNAMSGTTTGNLTNSGTINASDGIRVSRSGTVAGALSNTASGTITASNDGISVVGGGNVNRVENAGTITGGLHSAFVDVNSQVQNGISNTGVLDGMIEIFGGNGSGGGIDLLNSGTIDIGQSLSYVTGNFTQQSTGIFKVDLMQFSSYFGSPMVIGGNASLDGVLDLSFIAGFVSPGAGVFTLLDVSGATTGTFSNYADGETVGVYDGATLKIQYTANDVNLISTIPELDAGAATGALGLLAASLALVGERRRRRA